MAKKKKQTEKKKDNTLQDKFAATIKQFQELKEKRKNDFEALMKKKTEAQHKSKKKKK